MFTHSAVLLLAAAVGVLATPFAPRQISGPCIGLGGGGFDIPFNFTLAAYNSTKPNANTTGAPLVLGKHGHLDGAESEVLSTWVSYPHNQWPNFSLFNGSLIANSNGTKKSTVSAGATSGTFPSFISADVGVPAEVYCAVADTDPAGGGTGFPILAVNGQTDLFSLCKTGTSHTARNNLVYNATAKNSGGYKFETCYPVAVQVIEPQ